MSKYPFVLGEGKGRGKEKVRDCFVFFYRMLYANGGKDRRKMQCGVMRDGLSSVSSVPEARGKKE